jgi:2-polyprenyl-6-methoxyphenol hydroxylase-like FAD-dependent oxidoreductase
METDVLVVGAGPTGLMLANQLVRRGVRSTVIDRHSGPAQQSRAMAVQARTLEIYAKMGIIDDALRLGRPATGANMWANGRWAARIPLGDIGEHLSPFPFALALGQDDNERIMGARLHDHGIDVQWNTELIGFEQQSDGVEATLKQVDGSTRKVRAAWVAGCDGARSAVRDMSGITFPGAPYEHVFFVADTEATGSMRADELNVYLWQDGFHLFFPMRGNDRWRVIGILPKALRSRNDLRFEDLVTDIQREAGANLSFKECSWFSTYRIHHRCAERFRDRRAFLLGDAAHVHSPAGGQGMNTGLQDAYNLGWKLALVVKGQADPALLDTYEKERLPVAQRLMQTTDRLFRLLVSDSWVAGLFRTRILARIAARAMTVERIRTLAFRSISQIGIRYRTSPLSQTLGSIADAAPQAGDRFPWLRLATRAGGAVEDLFEMLDDRCFNLLVFGQPAPTSSIVAGGERVRVLAIPDDRVNQAALAAAGIRGRAFYVVRPDGHVGLAGAHFDDAAVVRYFAEHHVHVEEGSAPREARTATSGALPALERSDSP